MLNNLFQLRSVDRFVAIVTTFGLLISLRSLAEVIDYHQHLYGPEAGARSIPGPKVIGARELIAQTRRVPLRPIPAFALAAQTPATLSMPAQY
jgi:hypothetical protein